MTYEEREKVSQLLIKLHSKLITNDEVLELLALLAEDYWERGLE